VTVDDCGTSVLDVSEVLVVAPETALVDVVERAVVVVVADIVDVVEDELGLGLLEQAAKARAQAGSSSRPIDRFRRGVGILQCTARRS
jgi:hypothetical protein